jgi:hypothetical protein
MAFAYILAHRRDVLAAAAVLLLSTAGAGCDGSGSNASQADSGLASSGLIEVVQLPGMRNVRTTYTLFASGRVRIDRRARTGPERILEELEGSLSPAETQQLVDELFAAGLDRFDPGQLERRLRAEGRLTASVEDCVEVLFRFDLESTVREVRRSKRSFRHEFSIYCPSFLAERFPDQQEYQTIQRVLETFERVGEEARGRE